jgi:hypothetical protein
MSLEISGRIGRAFRLRAGWFKPAAAVVTSTADPTALYLTVSGTSTPIGDYASKATLSLNSDTSEQTGISSTTRLYMSAPRDGSLSFDANHDPALTTLLESTTGFTFYPGGTASGKPVYTSTLSLQPKSETKTANNDANRMTVSLTGPVTRTVVS